MQEGSQLCTILDLTKAISRKWCKIGGRPKLVLITNRKSYTYGDSDVISSSAVFRHFVGQALEMFVVLTSVDVTFSIR